MSVEYEKITNLIKKAPSDNKTKLKDICFYGVITYLCVKPKLTQVTLVDESCKLTERLKCNFFHHPDDLKPIAEYAELGDIVRCRHFELGSFNSNPQGVCATFSSWVCFKRNSNNFDYISKKANQKFDDRDKIEVKFLRDWLNTNPQLQALFEANLSTEVRPDEIDESEINAAACAMNMNSRESSKEKTKIENLKIVQFAKAQPETYADLICQVCAICISSGKNDLNSDFKLLFVWDGTITNYAVFQEDDFKFDLRKKTAFFSKEITSYIYQVFVFDEHINKCDSIEPGDYVLIKNTQLIRPKTLTGADLLFKIGGGGNSYGRTIQKLASHNLNFVITNPNQQITSIVNSIYEKGKELKISDMNENDFCACFEPNLQDDTFNEIMRNRNSEELLHVHLKPVISNVDKLLNDDTQEYEMLVADGENVTSSNLTVPNLTGNNNENKENELIEIEDQQQDLQKHFNNSISTFISPIKSLIPNVHFIQTMDIIETQIDKQKTQNVNSVSTSTQKFSVKIDSREISKQLFRVKRLLFTTHAVPFITIDSNYLTQTYFYNSLQCLVDQAQLVDQMRSHVICTVYNYSFLNCLPMTSVFVHCKNCDYINFTPLNLASAHHKPTVNQLLRELASSKNNEDEINNLNELRRENAVNFSLNWIYEALPNDLQTQTCIQNEGNGIEETPIMFYQCPRCLYNQQQENNDETSEIQMLEYIYRFWFKLRDENSQIDFCLMESDTAEKFVNVSPVKYYTREDKMNAVYEKIVKNFQSEYFLTIDTFKLPEKATCNNQPKILYKITNFRELKQCHF